MTERTTNKAKIEPLLQAGKAPAEIAKILGVDRRCAKAVAWRMRNPERAKAIKRAGREGLRADEEKGKPTGKYTHQGNLANKALELLGKELVDAQ